MDLLINTDLNITDLLLLPLYTPYASRHLQKKGCLNKIIAGVEFIPGISLIATLIEKIIHFLFDKISLLAQNFRKDRFALINPKANPPSTIIMSDRVFRQHYTGPTHPEASIRIVSIEEALERANLKQKENTLAPRKATSEEIQLCHSKEYMLELKRQTEALNQKSKDHSIPFDKEKCATLNVQGDFNISSATYETALFAAGAPLTAIDKILDPQSTAKRAFCIVRPPGHHAHATTGSGFCAFNNVAIAAKYALTKGVKNVLIVDWDLHHGDGTQTLTQEDPNIFYFSTHRDTSNGFYPDRYWGSESQIGSGKGIGTVVNCPIDPTKSNPREEIMKAFKVKLMNAMTVFQPELVLISCGFDGHKDDLFHQFNLTSEDYAELTRICIEIANKYAKGRIVSILEGGYSPEAIAEAAKAHVFELNRN